ncbi:protein O-mannosyl-transferase family [Verrucomicrobiota bacterium]
MEKDKINEKIEKALPKAEKFFRKIDWLALGITFVVALIVYVMTLAPTVTLEDSGELAVAADYLGVPHPPGYPIWTMISWVFQIIFHGVKYHGHPNPAWAVGLCSAFFGALASGLVAMLINRSGSDLTGDLKNRKTTAGTRQRNLLLVSSIAAGLLLAFSSVLWSQSVIVEVYSLNAFFLALILVLAYRWMCCPDRNSILYITALVFGLGLTNHQSLTFIMPALMAALLFRDPKLFRDSLVLILWATGVFFCIKSGKFVTSQTMTPEKVQFMKFLFRSGAAVCFLCPIVYFLIKRSLLTEWKRLLFIALFVFLGLSVYIYMPLASSQNPPMNWGYTRTWEGFKHALFRKQYDGFTPVKNMINITRNPVPFFKQLHAVITDPGSYSSVIGQFSLFISLLAFVPLFAIRKINKKFLQWLVITMLAFFFFTVVFIIFQNPKVDTQTLFICRVQYIQGHVVFALWLGYGLITLLFYSRKFFDRYKWAYYVSAVIVLCLPAVSILRNAYDSNLSNTFGSCEQNGHDFGWQFGYWQLCGAEGILEELPDEERASFPNPAYPPAVDKNAVVFGGTDPGRFVPTYMIYSAKVREDTYLITQNALADNTYLSVMRDLYGDRIWIPGRADSNTALSIYIQEVNAGKRPPNAQIKIVNGQVQIKGSMGVMEINGILARMIFEQNKEKHSFYVEESYAIPWMYPYLEPHGLIMKINKNPIPEIKPETVKNDRDFWDWLTGRLLNNPKFLRDVPARKSFSKLRSSIAGLYARRQMFKEAEHAFKQALELHPRSPEANMRLAELYVQAERFSDAGWLAQKFLGMEPENVNAGNMLNRISSIKKMKERCIELEGILKKNKTIDIIFALELADIYVRLNNKAGFRSLISNILSTKNLPVNAYFRVGQICFGARQPDLLCAALKKCLELKPDRADLWMEMAAGQLLMNDTNQSLDSLKKAVEVGGISVKARIRGDKRFSMMRNMPAFQEIVKIPILKKIPILERERGTRGREIRNTRE